MLMGRSLSLDSNPESSTESLSNGDGPEPSVMDIIQAYIAIL